MSRLLEIRRTESGYELHGLELIDTYADFVSARRELGRRARLLRVVRRYGKGL